MSDRRPAALAAGVSQRDRGRLLLLRVDLRAQALFLLAKLGRELGAEILGFEDLADLDLGRLALERRGAALHPLDGLVERLDLDDPEARDELLRLGERTVDDRALAVIEADARALRARLQAFARKHDARLDELLVELA